jgi:hypothetical protein
VSLEPGHWVRWSDGLSTVWLRIDAIARTPALDASPPTSSSSLVWTTVRGPAWREGDAGLVTAEPTRQAQRFTLELRVVQGTQTFRLTPVGLTPRHPASWWQQMNDGQYYATQQNLGAGPAQIAVTPATRAFPLAPQRTPMPLAWLPLGVEPLFGASTAPLPDEATALERDGLDLFEAGLFLDPELATVSVGSLAELADNIRFLREHPRHLLGIHSAFSIGNGGVFNETTLLAIPDAIHLGWDRRPDGPIPTPHPSDIPAPAHWRTHRGPCAPGQETDAEEPDFAVFLDCNTGPLTDPETFDGPEAVLPGTYQLTWSAVDTGDYVLQEATQADLSDAREIYRGRDTAFVVLNTREGVYYYRLFIERGDERSRGSDVVAVRVRRDEWVQRRFADDDPILEATWLAVHRAALRLAMANGDLFVVLGMPRDFRTPHALRYASRLRTVRQATTAVDAGAFDPLEARALSYGALYFPWLQTNIRDGVANERRTPRVVPPDGASMGVLAARASLRGAWVAPANEPLKDVVALTPVLPESEWQAIQDAQINWVRLDPRGLFTLAADTLSLDADVRPINVRRLLILLRRLSLRRGATYVFEPNGPALRRAVEHSFTELLTNLFRRGAFAGATAAESFRVVTDDTINTARDADAGRFVVELRVAPSLPLRFLSLRLRQQGERLTVMEEL